MRQSLLLLRCRSRHMSAIFLGFRSQLLLLLPLEFLSLILIFSLRIPLPGLQDEHSNQHKRQYGITGGKHSQAVFSTNSGFC